ncbi:TetR/AcrR family transcriptional regulator C-terminal domain-containing protein [Streptomyces sp. NPDC092296]|uniref:TetR/AcrR family transcriptional regulator C-terminal domain-containing protein n=1 Tax=Streptomyces sp. NPDC092296 TaxID=3366012 RepID=UPI0037F8B7A9
MATRLDRLTVVETALRLLNETGLDGLTLRRIATELDVKAPALYWHFAGKQALLDEMATEMLRRMVRAGEAAQQAEPPCWQQWLADGMRQLRATLLSYRDGAKVFSGTRLTDSSHAPPMERTLRTLVDQGFSVEAAGRAWFTGYTYTIGFVIEEQAVYPAPGERDPRYESERRAGQLGPEYPLAGAVGPTFFTGHDEGFEAGLAIIVAGIEATLHGRG